MSAVAKEASGVVPELEMTEESRLAWIERLVKEKYALRHHVLMFRTGSAIVAGDGARREAKELRKQLLDFKGDWREKFQKYADSYAWSRSRMGLDAPPAS